MSGGYRFTRFHLVPTSGQLVFRAQCEVCEEIGPRAETGDAAMMWVVFHWEDHPGHTVYRELSSIPYLVEPRS
ncbi:DUF7848 domain-containing protein [Streptomyces otsuchiensis]|uniref:DUF7848 domain-containing protein n=1 Tax=Streptomyces otsuchiensis TaxID=2681388 RepID=UPI001030CD4E|nr:hypothetical protein [Streptomyces otsuchiensis]